MPSETLRQHGAMCAAKEGNSRLGIPRKVGAEFCHADKGRHFSKHNANTTLRVVSTEESGDGMVTVHLEGENGAVADLPFPAEEASAYAEGSEVVLHCVPAAEEGEAMESEAHEGAEPPEAEASEHAGPTEDERLADAVKNSLPEKYRKA